MDRKEQVKLLEKWYEEKLEISEAKGHDYAGEDMLDNFKRVSFMCAILKVNVTQPEGIAIIYSLLKLDRLCNLLFSNRKPSNESIDDTVMDLGLYIDLLRMILAEQKENGFR